MSASGLPRTDDLRHPRQGMMRTLRPPFRAVIKRWWDVTVTGEEHFPSHGPVVVVGNHIGFIDGPLMAILGPRPVHALTKSEMFTGPLGTFLTAAGQIPLERLVTDSRAIRTSIKVLQEGGAVGVFPEGTRGGGELTAMKRGAAYLAMVTGAQVQPVIYLGTRMPGGSSNSLPPRRSRMTVTYGEPVAFEAQPWPRRTADVTRASEAVGVALRDTLAQAQRLSGIDLPGPIPIKDPRHD